jgi:DNA-binding transcriptional LysR family regulator
MRTIGLLWRKEHHHSRAAREFLRLLREACGAKDERA